MNSWQKLSTKTLLQHPRLTVVEDEVKLPGGHTTTYLRFDKSQDAVTVIAIDENKILVQQEYSYPPNQVMYQFPGGGIEKGEQPKEAALRELKEESGYTGHTTYLGYYFSNNRRSTAKMHVVLVNNVKECHKEGGDIEESVISMWFTRDQLKKMIAAGEIVNYSILAGMSLLNARSE